MRFDPRKHKRSADGRFSEKTGSAPEVTLASAPRGYTLTEDAQPYGIRAGWTQADLDRVNEFVRESGMQLAERHTGRGDDEGPQYDRRFVFPDGRVVKGGKAVGSSSATQAAWHLLWLARQARDFPNARDAYGKGDRLAREVFGDRYESLVNPKKASFWDRLRGRA